MLKDKITIFSLAISSCLPLFGLTLHSFYIRIFFIIGFIHILSRIYNKVIITPHIKVLIFFNIYILLNFIISPFFVVENLLVLPTSEIVTLFNHLNLMKYEPYKNFSQLFYPLFWLLFTVVFSTYLSEKNRLVIFYKTILLFYIVVSFSGYLYIYSPSLFDNVFTGFLINFHDAGYFSRSPWGYGIQNIPRMASIIGEPSNNLLLTILIIGPLIFFSTQSDQGIFKHRIMNNFFIILVLLNLILMQSSAVIIAFIFLLFLTFAYSNKKTFKPHYVLLIILLAILFFSIYLNPIIDKIIYLKGSGIIRAELNLFTLEIIIDHLLLGIGFGAHRTTSLILFISVSLGIVGLSTWFYLIYMLMKLKLHTINKDAKLFLNGFKVSFMTTTFLTFISFSESLFVLPFYWLNIIFIISLYIKYNRNNLSYKYGN